MNGIISFFLPEDSRILAIEGIDCRIFFELKSCVKIMLWIVVSVVLTLTLGQLG
jgi:hypothetical protein